MGNSKETDPYHQYSILSPKSVQLLLSGNFSQSNIDQIQNELHAYVPIKAGKFGGIIYHPDGIGPEYPYLKPTHSDLIPEIQAIGRIGVQYDYWDLFHKKITSGTMSMGDFTAMSIAYLFKNHDGTVGIQTNSDPDSVEEAAKGTGDSRPKYPKYTNFVSFGGDADFYGSDMNQIFPMDVPTYGNKKVDVQRTALGLSEEVTQRTWDSWRAIDEVWGTLFHEAFTTAYQKLPSRIQSFFYQANRSDRPLNLWSVIGRVLFNHGGSIEDYNVVQQVMFTELQNYSRHPQLLAVTKTHAANLQKMYQTAKTYRRDIYHY